MVYSALVVITRDTASNSIFVLTAVIQYWVCEWALLHMRWIKISLYIMSISASMSCPLLLHKSHGRRGQAPPPKSIIVHFYRLQPECSLIIWMNCEDEPLHELRGDLLSIQPESETCCATIPQRDNQWPSYCYEFHPHPAIMLLVYL